MKIAAIFAILFLFLGAGAIAQNIIGQIPKAPGMGVPRPPSSSDETLENVKRSLGYTEPADPRCRELTNLQKQQTPGCR
jgi:hypothetical protein